MHNIGVFAVFLTASKLNPKSSRFETRGYTVMAWTTCRILSEENLHQMAIHHALWKMLENRLGVDRSVCILAVGKVYIIQGVVLTTEHVYYGLMDSQSGETYVVKKPLEFLSNVEQRIESAGDFQTVWMGLSFADGEEIHLEFKPGTGEQLEVFSMALAQVRPAQMRETLLVTR
jgi:hypothetical protein